MRWCAVALLVFSAVPTTATKLTCDVCTSFVDKFKEVGALPSHPHTSHD
jgi:hypothetical protein